jgi:hypothetical protein
VLLVPRVVHHRGPERARRSAYATPREPRSATRASNQEPNGVSAESQKEQRRRSTSTQMHVCETIDEKSSLRL